jgi:hypothetical protein
MKGIDTSSNESKGSMQIEDDLVLSFGKIDVILAHIPTALERVRALMAMIGYCEQLRQVVHDGLRNQTDPRAQLERFERSFRQRSRMLSGEIIEGEYTVVEEQSPEVETHSIVPNASDGTS